MVYSYQPVSDKVFNTIPISNIKEPFSFNIKQSFKKGRNAGLGVGEISEDKVLSPGDRDYQTIRKVFEENYGSKMIADGTHPALSQTFVSCTLYYDYNASYGHRDWCEANFLTLAIVPCYGDLMVYEIEYELFKYGIFQTKYTYRYSMKGATWIGLIPFFWLNLFTNSYEDALANTALQFLSDAKKDGLF
ncbi:MAG: hypothetical protein AB7T38_02990 [Nitrospirales bacterium]